MEDITAEDITLGSGGVGQDEGSQRGLIPLHSYFQHSQIYVFFIQILAEDDGQQTTGWTGGVMDRRVDDRQTDEGKWRWKRI